MGVWIKGLILGCFTIGILIGSLVDRTNESPSVESYWLQTGLSQTDLFKFLQDTSCHSSDQYFLACLNAIQQVAIRNGLMLLPGKGLTSMPTEKLAELSERDLLSPWLELLKKRTAMETLIDFQEQWKTLSKKYLEINEQPMMVGVALNGFLSVFRDPHTYLIPIDYYRQIVANSDYRSSSYGFVITRWEKDFYVKKVIPGSPSDQSGLRRGQKIVGINDWDLETMNLSTLNDKIRADKEQEISIQIQLANKKVQTFNIKKATQALSTVHLKYIESSLNSTALLTLDRFTRRSCEKVKLALQEVRESGTRNLILDLRDNPGGQMDEAGCIASLFIGPDKEVFTVKYMDASDRNETYVSDEEKMYKGRIVILINRGTASASEILAGVLREYNQAILIGETTFGKGSFQEGDIWGLNPKIALFETKGFYYLPSGFSPQKRGLSPDLSVESANSGSREDNQYWNTLDLAQNVNDTKPSGLPFETCNFMDSMGALSPEDPEIGKAQQALNCWGVAQIPGGWR